jgi:hypothetical protein
MQYMLNKKTKYGICLLICIGFINPVYCQDKIYTTRGDVFEGKVVEVSPKEIQMRKDNRPDGLVYIYSQRNLDSIVYANGNVEEMQGFLRRKKRHQNIPQLNTISYDFMGLAFLSVSFSYERRLKNGKVGFRIPIYYGFKGGGIAGVGTFIKGFGAYYASDGQNYNYTLIHKNTPEAANGGYSIATGINPKIYLIKYRRVRPYIGPEVTFGYSTATNTYLDVASNGFATWFSYPVPGPKYIERDFTFAAVAKGGLMFHPSDWFNICIDGGAGIGGQFGKPNPIGWTGLWHAGLAIGVNF